MKGRNAVVGLCMLCALLVSAVAAQSAGAITGTTAFTCKKGVGIGTTYNTDHCVPGEPAGEYGHFTIAESTTTSLRASDAGGVTKLKSTVGGIGITITAEELAATGSPWMTNAVDPSGEHYIHGEGTATYSGVTVSGFSGKCFVYTDESGKIGATGTLMTEPIVGTTKGQGMGVKFAPVAGTVLARFWILDKSKKTSAEGGECIIGDTYEVTGSVIGTPEGATVTFTHTETTAQNTLKFGATGSGAKAGLEGKVTFEAEDTSDGTDTWTPLSPTTVTT